MGRHLDVGLVFLVGVGATFSAASGSREVPASTSVHGKRSGYLDRSLGTWILALAIPQEEAQEDTRNGNGCSTDSDADAN